MSKPNLPQSKLEWSAYRLRLTCDIGRQGLEKAASISNEHATALFTMFRAIEEIGTLIMEIRKEQQGCKSELPAKTVRKIHRRLSRAAGESMGGEA